jgi:hypothetical protein
MSLSVRPFSEPTDARVARTGQVCKYVVEAMLVAIYLPKATDVYMTFDLPRRLAASPPRHLAAWGLSN